MEIAHFDWTERRTEHARHCKVRIPGTDEGCIGYTCECRASECINKILQAPCMIVMTMRQNDSNRIHLSEGSDATYD